MPAPNSGRRVALITGGASGIGLATAQRWVRDGGQVVVWDVQAAGLQQAVASLGPAAHGMVVDVTNEAAVQSAMAQAAEVFGGLDAVINSAGIVGSTGPFWQQSLQDWQRVLDINLTGVFLVSKAAVPFLTGRTHPRIVHLASIAGKEGNRNQAAYSASKAAVIGLTKSMGKDLVDQGILVNCITPAIVQSALVDQMPASQRELVLAKIPMGRPGRVEEVAAMVCWLCSPECSFSTGAVFDLSGGRATY